MTISQAVKEIRKQLGMSQAELGYALHVTVTTICRWETGKSVPNSMARALMIDYCTKKDVSNNLIDVFRK